MKTIVHRIRIFFHAMMQDMAIIKDTFGPTYVIEVFDPQIGMEGFLVIDNIARGPGKGGIRMTTDVSVEEVFRLARTMTWKNALADIPFGGAKAGIVWPAATMSNVDLKKQFVQSFARLIKPFMPRKYVGGPDVGTGEREMQWIAEATGDWRSVTGKPANVCMVAFGKKGEKCGIPHEFGSTGFGVAHATAIAAKLKGVDVKGAAVAIHGFGNVGTFTFKFLTEMGARIVAVADAHTTVYDKAGLDVRKLQGIVDERKKLSEYSSSAHIKKEEFWGLPVDILIPASVTDVINDSNKRDIRAKIIVEAGNIPMSEKIENELFTKGIFIVPDFVANAGGVISSYAEYRGYNPKRMFEVVERKITKSTEAVLKRSLKSGRNPREVALEIATERVQRAMDKK